MGGLMDRADVAFASRSQTSAGWFYAADVSGRAPCVVMAHGLAGVKEMRLDAYAERFAAAGYHALIFDYRHFGASEGSPRQLVNIRRQHEDGRLRSTTPAAATRSTQPASSCGEPHCPVATCSRWPRRSAPPQSSRRCPTPTGSRPRWRSDRYRPRSWPDTRSTTLSVASWDCRRTTFRRQAHRGHRP